MRFLPLVFVLALIACGRTEPSVVIRGMYHWDNDRWLSGEEENFLDTHQVRQLFYKVLDIDWNEANHAFPVSINELPELGRYRYGQDSARGARLKQIELVPVVFITNRTMLRCDSAQLNALAEKLDRKLNALCKQPWLELQLDCDWSARTKDNFFALVRMMKERLHRRISVTVRLHQFKNPQQTGVPPADRGMLMMYNVDDVKRYDDHNSIFNAEAAGPYFQGAGTYPLPLDVALPNYSWVIQYRRGRFIGIQDQALADELDTFNVVERQANGLYRVVKEYEWWWDSELHIGDELKTERVDTTALQEAVELARTATNNDTVRVVFFDVQQSNTSNFPFTTYEHTWEAFR